MLEELQKFFTSYPVWARLLAGAGLATTFFTLILAPRGPSTASAPAKGDAWLVVKGVELFGHYPDAQVKVTALVNGTRYLYPSVGGVEWLEVGPSMAAQQFKLPSHGVDGYEIRFDMVLREPSRGNRTRSFASVQSAFIKNVPFDGNYELRLIQRGVRAPSVEGRVRFSVTTDPNV